MIRAVSAKLRYIYLDHIKEGGHGRLKNKDGGRSGHLFRFAMLLSFCSIEDRFWFGDPSVIFLL